MTGMHMLTMTTTWILAISAWDEELRSAGRSPETRYTRVYHLRRFAHDHPKTEPWDMTREHLVKWMARHEWKPETRRSYRSSLATFYRWGHAQGHIAVDPAYTLPPVKIPRARPRPAPNDVVDDALRDVDLRVRMMILVLAFTGMRRGELARLHTNMLERDLHGYQLRIIGKGGHERLIPVDNSLASTLRALPQGWVFPGQINGHISPHYAGKLVSRALGDGWTAHTLRHRFASLAYAVERDIRAVQELLGHASVTTTQIYTYVPELSIRRAAAGAGSGLLAA
ncbi:MAG: tyrosine-type recombinase/integrase [Rhodococcus sp. (in: high G+C Gram-positive bacteria)]